MLVANAFELGASYTDVKRLLVGIECEIEGLNCEVDWNVPGAFTVTEDGSLRNYGREFISLPQDIDVTVEYFKLLHEGLKYVDEDNAFSPRTSLHVHINCKPMEEAVVRNMVLLYALFEEVFFRMVDHTRRDNIHCVPLTETHLPAYYHNTLKYMVGRWSKYTALNLAPLAKQGTIEFRHMHGHRDPVLLKEWLTTLERLSELAKVEPVIAASLTPENINKWFSYLFSHTKDYQQTLLVLPQLIEDSIIDVKLGFM